MLKTGGIYWAFGSASIFYLKNYRFFYLARKIYNIFKESEFSIFIKKHKILKTKKYVEYLSVLRNKFT